MGYPKFEYKNRPIPPLDFKKSHNNKCRSSKISCQLYNHITQITFQTKNGNSKLRDLFFTFPNHNCQFQASSPP